MKEKNEKFMEGVVIKNYNPSNGDAVFAKVVIPLFEKTINALGRYEDYPAKNIVKLYSHNEYYNYLKNHVLQPIGLNKFPLEYGTVYKMYAMNFNQWAKKPYA